MTRLPDFQLIHPTSLAEVVAARRAHPDGRLLAGGTDLIPNLRRGIGSPSAVIDVTGLPGLQDIVPEPAGIRIGAGVTLSRLMNDSLITFHFPALVEAASKVAGPTHRAVATLGGNLCLDTRCVFYNQSHWWRQSNNFCRKHGSETCHVAPTGSRCHAAYSGDTAPVLLALGAEAEVGGADGTRWIGLEELFHEDGAAHLRFGESEMLLGVRVPLGAGLATGYEKARLRGAIDFPLAGVAVALRRSDDVLQDIRIALTGTNSRPLLLSGCGALIGRPLDDEAVRQIGKLVQKQVTPMRTTIAPAHYRRRVAAALACRLARRLYAAPPDNLKGAESLMPLFEDPPRLSGRNASDPTKDIAQTAFDAAQDAPTLNACDALLHAAKDQALRDLPALIHRETVYTYAQLEALVDRFGHALRDAGVGYGDRVLFLLKDTPELVAGYLAAMKVGGVAVALSTRFVGKDLRFAIDDTRSQALFIHAEFLPILDEALANDSRRPDVVVVCDAQHGTESPAIGFAAFLGDRAGPLESAPTLPDDAAFWIYTSGTTGTPKAAIHRHRDVLIAERNVGEMLGIKARDKLFSSSKLFFAFGLAHCLLGGLRRGATLILDDRWPRPEAVAEMVSRHRPDIMFSVPTMYRNLLDAGYAGSPSFRAVRGFVSAGERLPTALFERWQKETGKPIFDGIGASETLFLFLANTPAAYRPGATGRPQPGVELRLLDDQERPITAPGQPGVLWVRMDSICAGYWNQPEKTAATFDRDWYRTGDVFSFDDEGWWYHHGRGDDLLKISGQWVSPVEIEDCALTTPGIRDAAVIGLPNEDGLMRLVMFVVAADGADTTELASDIQARLKAGLSIYKCPRNIRFVSELPRTATGKIQRFHLRKIAEELRAVCSADGPLSP